jgi:hypothetical protein
MRRSSRRVTMDHRRLTLHLPNRLLHTHFLIHIAGQDKQQIAEPIEIDHQPATVV